MRLTISVFAQTLVYVQELFFHTKHKMLTVIMENKANYDEVTTQLFLGCFVVVVAVVDIVVVVLIVFVAVHLVWV